jgi:hypothetical protein
MERCTTNTRTVKKWPQKSWIFLRDLLPNPLSRSSTDQSEQSFNLRNSQWRHTGNADVMVKLSLCLNTTVWKCVGGSGHLHSLVALPPKEREDSFYQIGGCIGPRADLNVVVKRKIQPFLGMKPQVVTLLTELFQLITAECMDLKRSCTVSTVMTFLPSFIKLSNSLKKIECWGFTLVMLIFQVEVFWVVMPYSVATWHHNPDNLSH